MGDSKRNTKEKVSELLRLSLEYMKIPDIKYKKWVSWLLALVIVVPPYFAVFSPRVFAELRETGIVLGEFFAGESQKYAFVGIDPETQGSEVYFFDGSQNIRVTRNNVTDGNAQYDEFSNKIVYQSLIDGIWQIFLYDVASDVTTRLSFDGANNTDPRISKGQVAWQSWVDGQWEVYFYDGAISQRLTDNKDPDIEPEISNAYIVWSQYEPDQEGESRQGIDPDKYAIKLHDGQKKETKTLSLRGRKNGRASIEYPYVVWQIFDGNDYEISRYNISDGTAALLTNNDHDDLAPKFKNGKITWFEKVKFVPVAPPPNIVVEDGQIKLKPEPEGTPLPDWWKEPINCPEREPVCAYIYEGFTEYANHCYVEKAGGIVVHTGSCTGEEVPPTPTPEPFPEVEATPSVEASPSVSFEPSPEASVSEEVTVEPAPIISPSQSFEETATPEPSIELDPEFLEKGNFETEGSFDEEGNVLIEERTQIDSDTPPSETSSTSPTVEESVSPTIFEESTLMQIGEAINTAVSDTASATANIISNLAGGGEDSSEQTAPESAPAEELIPVVE